MPITQTQDVRAIANYLLAKAEVDQKLLGHLQLQKLAYLSHGWHLGLSSQPLFSQGVLAWPYGPVIRELYHEFKRFEDGPITAHASYYSPVLGRQDYIPSMTDYSKSVVDAVWKEYSRYTVGQLISVTHAPGTPWATVTSGLEPSQIRDIPISNTLIQRYYYELALHNQAKRA